MELSNVQTAASAQKKLMAVITWLVQSVGTVIAGYAKVSTSQGILTTYTLDVPVGNTLRLHLAVYSGQNSASFFSFHFIFSSYLW